MKYFSKTGLRIPIVFILILWLMSIGENHAYALSENPVEQAQYGVVRVLAVDSYNSLESTGTGFAVGDPNTPAEYFVTCYHVIEGASQVYISIDSLENAIYAEVFYTERECDLAVLKIAEPLTERHPLKILDASDVHKSQDIFALGFPGVVDYFSANSGTSELSSKISDITCTKGSVSNSEYMYNCEYGTIKGVLSEITINPGNSGGPIVDENGCVIGVAESTFGDMSLMSFLVGTEHIAECLDSCGVAYQMDSSDATGENDSAADGDTSEGTQAQNGAETGHENQKTGGVSRRVILIAAVVLILSGGIGLTVYLLRTRKVKAVILEELIYDEEADLPDDEPIDAGEDKLREEEQRQKEKELWLQKYSTSVSTVSEGDSSEKPDYVEGGLKMNFKTSDVGERHPTGYSEIKGFEDARRTTVEESEKPTALKGGLKSVETRIDSSATSNRESVSDEYSPAHF